MPWKARIGPLSTIHSWELHFHDLITFWRLFSNIIPRMITVYEFEGRHICSIATSKTYYNPDSGESVFNSVPTKHQGDGRWLLSCSDEDAVIGLLLQFSSHESTWFWVSIHRGNINHHFSESLSKNYVQLLRQNVVFERQETKRSWGHDLKSELWRQIDGQTDISDF